MNQRLCAPFAWDDSRGYDRGKVMTAQELEAGAEFARYKDVDGDGIPYRTYPGTHPDKGAYFTRGTSRNPQAQYSERGPGLRLQHAATAAEVRHGTNTGAATDRDEAATAARHGVIYFGSTSPAMTEAFEHLQTTASRWTCCGCARTRSRSGARLHRRARFGVRGRAEPRRAACARCW
jgi:2-oxoglutarate ferredoxin oxidoreductase subunit alpha